MVVSKEELRDHGQVARPRRRDGGAVSDNAASAPTDELRGTALAASGLGPIPRALHRKSTMNKTLIALLAAATATLSLGAYADTMTPSQADAAKTQAKGDYKADKAQAKADYNQNRADCKETTSGSVERACKKDAKAQEKQDKADAKLQYKQDKADIKSDTK